MPSDTKIPIKIVYTLARASKPMGLGEIARSTKLAKSHVLYHLKQLLRDRIVLRDGTRYVCQPFLTDNGAKEDLVALISVMISLLTKEIVVDDTMNIDTLGNCVIKNLDVFIQLYREGFFD